MPEGIEAQPLAPDTKDSSRARPGGNHPTNREPRSAVSAPAPSLYAVGTHKHPSHQVVPRTLLLSYRQEKKVFDGWTNEQIRTMFALVRFCSLKRASLMTFWTKMD